MWNLLEKLSDSLSPSPSSALPPLAFHVAMTIFTSDKVTGLVKPFEFSGNIFLRSKAPSEQSSYCSFHFIFHYPTITLNPKESWPRRIRRKNLPHNSNNPPKGTRPAQKLRSAPIRLHRGYIGIMEKRTETTRDYRGYIGIIRVILGLYRDNGKENGNYYSILGLY